MTIATKITNVPFSFRMSHDIRVQLKEEARSSDRSESYVAGKAIKRYLTGQSEKRRMIDVAVVHADDGQFISEESMTAWIDSWGSAEELAQPENDVMITKK